MMNNLIEQYSNHNKKKETSLRRSIYLALAGIALFACNLYPYNSSESTPTSTVGPFVPVLIETFTQIPDELLITPSLQPTENIMSPTPTKSYPTRTPRPPLVILDPAELDLSECPITSGVPQALAYTYQDSTETKQCFEVNPDGIPDPDDPDHGLVIKVRTQFAPPNNQLESTTSVKVPVNIPRSCLDFTLNWAGTDDDITGAITLQDNAGNIVYSHTPSLEEVEQQSVTFFNPGRDSSSIAFLVHDDPGLNNYENPNLPSEDNTSDISLLQFVINLGNCQ